MGLILLNVQTIDFGLFQTLKTHSEEKGPKCGSVAVFALLMEQYTYIVSGRKHLFIVCDGREFEESGSLEPEYLKQ